MCVELRIFSVHMSCAVGSGVVCWTIFVYMERKPLRFTISIIYLFYSDTSRSTINIRYQYNKFCFFFFFLRGPVIHIILDHIFFFCPFWFYRTFASRLTVSGTDSDKGQ